MNIPFSRNVGIVSVKLNVICKKNPAHTWGTYLDAAGNPNPGWDICLKCEAITRKEQEDNSNDQTQSRKFNKD